MYNWAAGLAEQYPFTVTETAKGRGAFLLYTEEGQKVVKEYRGSAERAEILSEVLTFLHDEDFLSEKIYRTKEEELISKDPEDGRYLCKDWLEGKECDTKSCEEILAATVKLAELHMTLKEYHGKLGEPVIKEEDALIKEYERHNRELVKVRNYIRSLKKKSEFEMLYLNHFEEFHIQAREAFDSLKAVIAELGEEEKKQITGLCHGDYSHHNILYTKQGIAVINFEQISYGFQIEDLVHFMRKMMEKHNWNVELGLNMVDAYDEIRRLSVCEKKMLYDLLTYPEKFWKIGNRYYNVRKSWISGRNIEKLDKLLRQEENRKQFLGAFGLKLTGSHV